MEPEIALFALFPSKLRVPPDAASNIALVRETLLPIVKVEVPLTIACVESSPATLFCNSIFELSRFCVISSQFKSSPKALQ